MHPMNPASVLPLAATALLLTLTACQSAGTAPASNAGTDLFNGRNLEGWKHVLKDTAVPRDAVWTVRDGVLICRGEPLGFLYSTREFTNFRLEVEYRWAPGAAPGNSGIFSRIHGTFQPLPPCAETQLQHGNVGDILTLQGFKLTAGQPRYFHVDKHPVAGDIDGVRKTANAEKPAGEWNRVVIEARENTYTVWVNDQQVNQVTGIPAVRGPIGLQSEGGEIHFRRVRITGMP